MVASISTSVAAVLPDITSSAPTQEVSTPQAPPPSTTEKSTTSQQTTQDSVDLSSKALSLSQALNEQHDQKNDLQKEAVKQQEQTVQNDQKAYVAAGKQYPPFMGNINELKLLKQTSPALYREILRMIVPPPINISYSDAQMLQNTNVVKTAP